MSYKPQPLDTLAQLTLRAGHAEDPHDRSAVARLAALDSAPIPPAPYVIAVVGERPVAARSLVTGATVADPFARTAHILPMLALRADQLTRAAGGDRRRLRGLRARLRVT